MFSARLREILHVQVTSNLIGSNLKRERQYYFLHKWNLPPHLLGVLSSFDVTFSSLDVTSSSLDVMYPSLDATFSSLDVTYPSLDVTLSSLDATYFSLDVTLSSLDATYPSLDVTSPSLDVTSRTFLNILPDSDF